VFNSLVKNRIENKFSKFIVMNFKQLIIIFFGLLFPIFVCAQSNFHNIHYLDPYNPEYVKGEVLVKFKDEVQVESSFKSGVALTGVSSVDKLLQSYQMEEVSKVFKETREQRQRKTVRIIRDFKGNEIEVPALFNIYKLKFDTIWDAKQIIEELQKDKNIEFAEPNYLVYTNEVIENGFTPDSPPVYMPLPSTEGDRDTYPNDPLYQDGSQWYLNAINAPAAWDSVTGDTTQIIAIIDTGVDLDHPDLDDNIWTNWNEIPDNGIDDDNNGYIDDTRGWDYINNDNDPNDDNSHGTHVAGIAAAEGNNGIGICGVVWNAQIIPIKMLQSSGSGNSSDLASAIEYASDNGATVINMSLGSYGESIVVKIACENAYAGTGDGEGSMLVAAAGNDGNKVDPPFPPFPKYMPMFPACYSFVIGVQASTSSGNRAGFSNMDLTGPVIYINLWGHNYEITSPGVGILSCKPNGSYWTKNGTSMASPEIAGAVTLMRQYHPDDSGEEIFAKLIQGTNSNLLDIYNSLIINLTPDLYYIDYTIVDTLPGCDGDGIADAGETIELYFTVKNAGGQADSVWTKMRFAEFEDTTTAIIIDSTSYIGSMSAYSTMTGNLDPITIKIDAEIANNRDIVFEFEIGFENIYSINGEIIIKVQHGVEIGGFYTQNLNLIAGKEYLGTQSVVIDTDDTLFIEPGVRILMNDNKAINVKGTILAIGSPDSMIVFTAMNNGWAKLILNKGVIEYSIIEQIRGDEGFIAENPDLEISNSIIRFNNSDRFLFLTKCRFLKTNIVQNFPTTLLSNSEIIYGIETFDLEHCNVMNNRSNYTISPIWCKDNTSSNYLFSNIFNNKPKNLRGPSLPYYVSTFNDSSYWGYSKTESISETIHDYFDDPQYGIINIENFQSLPDSEAHGIVWKILINNILINKLDNPNNSSNGLGMVGAETLRFDVYFNRPMDTSYIPLLTFGVREPYTQHIIADSTSWSNDSTIWTAYTTINATTGDGIQRVRVANARDDERFEIPIEDSRFEFVIQAASAASVQFIATPGIGKVDLEWPPTPTEDALGYNLYRFYNLTDSTYSDTVMINSELILDTLFTDYNVIPDTTYHYLYKTLGTDMVETDYSKKATATPFNAANGDANGDLAVNVLDITTIVSYMLNQNPSPFLFDAADVNYDDDINVLDIIGLVQLINSKKSATTKPLPEVSNDIAYYQMFDNKLILETKGNIAGLQFTLKATMPAGRQESKQPKAINKLKIFSLVQGFEFAYAVVDNEIVGILYSLSEREIPEGISELFRFEGLDPYDIQITEIIGGDLQGNYVPVLKKGESNLLSIDDAELVVSPNPFTNTTTINYTVPENGIVSIKIFNLNGSEIIPIASSYRNAGYYSLNWDGINRQGQKLKSGIYLLQMKVESVSGNKYNKEVKIVLTR